MSFVPNDIIILENSIKYLRRHLAWPPKNKEFDSKFYPVFYMIFFGVWLTTSTLWFGEIVYLVLAKIGGNVYDFGLDLAILVSLSGAFYLNFQFVRHVKSIAEVCSALSDLTTFGKPYKFDEKNQKLKYYAKCHYIYIIILAICFAMAPLIEYNQCSENYRKYGHPTSCGLITNIWTPFDQKIFPRTQLLYLLQMYCSIYAYVPSSIISFALVECVEHIILRFQHVGSLFVEAVNEKNSTLRKNKLYNCVIYHNAVFKLAEQFDSSVDGFMFMHVLLTGAILGLIAYSLLQRTSLIAIALLVGWFVGLTMACLVGQRLQDESVAVGDSICTSNWYKVEVDIQKDLQFSILRCRKPAFLHSGPFGYMSFSTIITILKTAYSYFTLMTRTS